MSSAIRIPRGTRDFMPQEALERKYLLQIFHDVFALHGFLPIETPAMEMHDTLVSNYGEGQRLIFHVLDSGNYLQDAPSTSSSSELLPYISKKALRYDLTVPFARFTAQNYQHLPMPFRRYQIQPVWRADRPQKSRYREFYQCDADIIGSRSAMCEVDMFLLIDTVFSKLAIDDYTIQCNHRGLMRLLAEGVGRSTQEMEISIVLDKYQSVQSLKTLRNGLLTMGFTNQEVNSIQQFCQTSPEHLVEYFDNIGLGEKSNNIIHLLYNILDKIKNINNILYKRIRFNPQLARGMDYYTGMILEITHKDAPNSLLGGGRYDNLTRKFGVDDLSGVGISFGFDRIYDLLKSRNFFQKQVLHYPQVLICNTDDEVRTQKLLLFLRNHGIRTEYYPEHVRLRKQLHYARKKDIAWAVSFAPEGLELIDIAGDRMLKIENNKKLLEYIRN